MKTYSISTDTANTRETRITVKREDGDAHPLSAEVEALVVRAGGRVCHHVVYRTPGAGTGS